MLLMSLRLLLIYKKKSQFKKIDLRRNRANRYFIIQQFYFITYLNLSHSDYIFWWYSQLEVLLWTMCGSGMPRASNGFCRVIYQKKTSSILLSKITRTIVYPAAQFYLLNIYSIYLYICLPIYQYVFDIDFLNVTLLYL